MAIKESKFGNILNVKKGNTELSNCVNTQPYRHIHVYVRTTHAHMFTYTQVLDQSLRLLITHMPTPLVL